MNEQFTSSQMGKARSVLSPKLLTISLKAVTYAVFASMKCPLVFASRMV
jgi:hypothetical protein